MDSIWLWEPSVKSYEHFIEIALVWVVKPVLVKNPISGSETSKKHNL